MEEKIETEMQRKVLFLIKLLSIWGIHLKARSRKKT